MIRLPGFSERSNAERSNSANSAEGQRVFPLTQSVAITDESYEDILRVIEAMATVFERSPTTFRKMHEPDLRNVLLVGLNATFKGKATGETFNGEGKSRHPLSSTTTPIFFSRSVCSGMVPTA